MHDRIIVRRLPEKDMSKGGLHIPSAAKEKPVVGEVVAVGDGKLVDGEAVPMEIFEGDHVLFEKFSGNEVKLNGEDHLILREDDILGVVTDD
jgi:chaperonin GroES